MTDAGVPDSVAAYITGHAGAGRGSSGTYKHFQDTLRSLEKVQYPELDLKRVYWPQKWGQRAVFCLKNLSGLIL